MIHVILASVFESDKVFDALSNYHFSDLVSWMWIVKCSPQRKIKTESLLQSKDLQEKKIYVHLL